MVLGRSGINVKRAIPGKVDIGNHAQHTGLAFTEKIAAGITVARRALHSVQRIHASVFCSYRKAFAFFGKKHRTVG